MEQSTAVSDLSRITYVLDDGNGNVPETYREDGRKLHGNALVAVAPSSIEEVQAVVAYVREHGLRIVPQGARTGLVGGTIPEDKDAATSIIMSLERMRGDIEYNDADGRVIVAAGMHLDEVNEYLVQFGVKVAIDISVNPQMGGMASTNVGGSSVVRYGDFRSMCRGVEMVTGAGETYSTLSQSPKHNGGPDFTSVIVGSNGVLGVITRVELDVFPVVAHAHTIWCQLDDDADLTLLVSAIKQNFGDSLIACDFLSKQALAAVKDSPEQEQSRTSLPFEGDVSHDVVFIECEGVSPDFGDDDVVQEKLMALLEQYGLSDPDILPREATWDIRHRTSDAVATSGMKLIGCDISTVSRNIGAMRDAVRARVTEDFPDLVIADFGHIADGGFHMNIVVPHEFHSTWSPEQTFEVRRAVSEIAHAFGGDFSAEHGRGATNREIAREFADPLAEQMMSALKAVVDPDNVMGHLGSQPIVGNELTL